MAYSSAGPLFADPFLYEREGKSYLFSRILVLAPQGCDYLPKSAPMAISAPLGRDRKGLPPFLPLPLRVGGSVLHDAGDGGDRTIELYRAVEFPIAGHWIAY